MFKMVKKKMQNSGLKIVAGLTFSLNNLFSIERFIILHQKITKFFNSNTPVIHVPFLKKKTECPWGVYYEN